MEVYDAQRTYTLDDQLAPSFGILTKNSTISIDDVLEDILSSTVRTLRNIPENERTWKTIMEAVRQNSLLETAPQDDVTRVESPVWEGEHRLMFDRSSDPAIANEVSYSPVLRAESNP